MLLLKIATELNITSRNATLIKLSIAVVQWKAFNYTCN